MAIRFEEIKPKIGSRVVWDKREDIFTPEAAAAIRAKVEERTVVVFPKLNLTYEEQLRITDAMGGKAKLTGQFNVQDTDENVYQVTLDKEINPQPEICAGHLFLAYGWHAGRSATPFCHPAFGAQGFGQGRPDRVRQHLCRLGRPARGRAAPDRRAAGGAFGQGQHDPAHRRDPGWTCQPEELPTAILPTQDVWPDVAPTWAIDLWPQLRAELEKWCGESNVWFEPDPEAAVY